MPAQLKSVEQAVVLPWILSLPMLVLARKRAAKAERAADIAASPVLRGANPRAEAVLLANLAPLK